MTLRRTFDASLLNRVMEHEQVRPYLGFSDGPIDVSPVVRSVDNVCLVNEYGGFILRKHAVGTYEVHTQFLPEFRGKRALEAACEAAWFMFIQTDCLEVLTKCPDCSRPASVLAQLVGFRKVFRQEACWGTPNGERCGVDYYTLTLDEWLARDAQVVLDGVAFHAELEELGVHPDHPEDEAHHRAAGMAYRMMLEGNPVKAVVQYNRWAAFTGYHPIALLSVTPLVVDIGNAVLGISKTCTMEVLLKCQLEQGSAQQSGASAAL